METLGGTAAALRDAAATLDLAARRLATLDPGTGAWGAGGPGRLGDLGRDLYLRWQRAVDARSREALAHAARIQEVADAVARAGDRYARIDDSARRQQSEAM